MGHPRVGIVDEDRRLLKVSGSSLEPVTAPIQDACRFSGLSRSEIYRRLAAGDIRAVKSGSRTLIVIDSLRAHLAGLPAARFRAPRETL